MKKKIIVILLIAVVLIAAITFGTHYLNTYYLPQKIKIKITQELSRALNAEVKLEGIELNLFKGIVLSNLSIANPKDKTIVLQIKNLNASFLLLPFFKEKKIIFPSININNAVINIIRHENNNFNIQEFIPKNTGEKKSPLPFSILIYKININDSEVNFLDKVIQPNLNQTLSFKNIQAQINPAGINFHILGELLDKAKLLSTLDAKGVFQFKTQELKINSHIDKLDILPYLAYLKNIPITITALSFNDIGVECILQKNKLSINAAAKIPDCSLIKDETSFSEAKAKLKALFNADLKNTADFDYLINIDELNAVLKNPQIPDGIQIEYAKLKINPIRADIENAKINLSDAPIDIKGYLENFSNPVFNFKLKSTTELSVIQNIINGYSEFLKTIGLKGETNLELTISKTKNSNELNYEALLDINNLFIKSKEIPLEFSDSHNTINVDGKIELNTAEPQSQKTPRLEFKGVLDLENALIKTAGFPNEISAINGQINFNNNSADWKNLSFNTLENTFNSNLSISNFNQPSIQLELNTSNINISTEINSTQKNIFNINNFSGEFYNSTANANGSLDITEPNKYLADIDINSQINLDDLKQIQYVPKENLSKINPQGKFKATGKIKGDIKNPKALNALLELNSSELKLYGFKLENLEAQLALENQQIKIPQSNCQFYRGSISLNGLLDLEKENFPFAFKIQTNGIDLSLLKLDTPIKDKELEGILSSTTILSGNTKLFLEELKGQGQFLIKDGMLWEFNPLEKLGDFLFIPRDKELIFKEAKADFNIADKKASTENLLLSSDLILLFCEGSIDFFGILDLDITPKPAVIGEELEKLGEYDKFLAGIFSEAGGIVTIKMTGPINNPKLEKKMIMLKVLDKVKDEVIDKIKGIADLIFGKPR